MSWPTLILCRAELSEDEAGEGVVIARLHWVGYVGSISVAGPTMDAAREHRRG
jgi:hypothetical protein